MCIGAQLKIMRMGYNEIASSYYNFISVIMFYKYVRKYSDKKNENTTKM